MDKGEDLMFKSRYKEAYNTIRPSKELISDVIRQARIEKSHDRKKIKKNRNLKKNPKNFKNRLKI